MISWWKKKKRGVSATHEKTSGYRTWLWSDCVHSSSVSQKKPLINVYRELIGKWEAMADVEGFRRYTLKQRSLKW